MGAGTLIKNLKLESTIKKAKKLCKTKRDFNKFIDALADERDFRELMQYTASSYWKKKRKPQPIGSEQQEEII